MYFRRLQPCRCHEHPQLTKPTPGISRPPRKLVSCQHHAVPGTNHLQHEHHNLAPPQPLHGLAHHKLPYLQAHGLIHSRLTLARHLVIAVSTSECLIRYAHRTLHDTTRQPPTRKSCNVRGSTTRHDKTKIGPRREWSNNARYLRQGLIFVLSCRVVDPRTLHDFLVGGCRVVSRHVMWSLMIIKNTDLISMVWKVKKRLRCKSVLSGSKRCQRGSLDLDVK